MSDSPEMNKLIETTQQLKPEKMIEIENIFGATYVHGICNLFYAMITCRPNISFPLIKLSQYSIRPVLEHFKAVQGIFKNLKETKEEGLYHWRKIPRHDRPVGNNHVCAPTNNYTPQDRDQHHQNHGRFRLR